MFNRIISQTVQRSKSAVQIKPCDYVGDGSKTLYINGEVSKDAYGRPLTDKGLLYCGKCNTLKQYRIYAPFADKVIEPYVECDCERQLDEQEHRRIAEENRQRQIDLNLSQADSLMLKNTFALDKSPDSDAGKLFRDYCRHWRDNFRPKNIGLYIFGDVGVGKTFYASCVANEIARVYGDTVRALSVTKAINDIFSATDKSGYIEGLASVDLLVLDDFGTERKTEYGLEQIYSIIDERYKAQKPIILTSNLDYKALSQKAGIPQQRIFDRVKDMCVPVKMDGKSKRGISI